MVADYYVDACRLRLHTYVVFKDLFYFIFCNIGRILNIAMLMFPILPKLTKEERTKKNRLPFKLK